ncbi:hypothetical protein, partial [Providencia rettgeri]|uniref:hypothetical protein n=1 Tax=Providencia rettgeri TaxID=587 RepID=UPI0039F53BC4
AITYGAAAPRSVRGSLGHCDRCHRLSVLYFPFSETTPLCREHKKVWGIYAAIASNSVLLSLGYQR